MSVREDVSVRSLGTNAGIWGFISLLVALFTGGWVTTQVTVGESRTEAMLYGVVLWATTCVLLLWLAANGVQAGMDTAVAMNLSNHNQVATTVEPIVRLIIVQRIYSGYDRPLKKDHGGLRRDPLSMAAAIAGAIVGRLNSPFAEIHVLLEITSTNSSIISLKLDECMNGSPIGALERLAEP